MFSFRVHLFITSFPFREDKYVHVQLNGVFGTTLFHFLDLFCIMYYYLFGVHST